VLSNGGDSRVRVIRDKGSMDAVNDARAIMIDGGPCSIQFHPEAYEMEHSSGIILNSLRLAGITNVHEKYSKAFQTSGCGISCLQCSNKPSAIIEPEYWKLRFYES
jgi:hypothetical protein